MTEGGSRVIGDECGEVVSKIRCDCGNWLEADARNRQVECECGKSFAVTVTEMW